MVIVGIKILTALFGGSGSDKTSTKPVATKSPQATVEPNKSSSDKTTANKSTEAKSNVSNERSPAFLYEALQKTETTPFTLTEKAKVFLKENPSLFSTKSKDALASFVNSDIEYKHLNKNINNYGDKLIKLSEAYVVEIAEEELEKDFKVTTINVMDENENQYMVYYIGAVEDVFEKDIISVYGLPIGQSGFENTNGGSTNCIILAGSYVKKAS